jgi:outer membrane putative beta-barrel porin/alpha-amylase
MKFGLTAESRYRPELALISMTSTPSGDARFSSAGIDPTLKLAWSKSLNESTSVAGNVSISSLSDSGERFSQRAVSFQLSRGLWRKWGGFWEAYLVTPDARGGESVWTFDTGVSYALRRGVQLDVSVGQQIAPLARCWFAGAGIVVELPGWFGRQ